MTLLSLTPAILGFLLLALHFFRSDHLPAMGLSLLLLGLLLLRRPWVPRMLQFFLLLGSAEWLRTAVVLVLARKEMGEPFLRLACIVGGVSLGTALASLFFFSGRIKTYFRADTTDLPDQDSQSKNESGQEAVPPECPKKEQKEAPFAK